MASCAVSQPGHPSAGRWPKAAPSTSPHRGSRSSSCFFAVARPWGGQLWPRLRKGATLPRPLLGSAQPRTLTPCPGGGCGCPQEPARLRASRATGRRDAGFSQVHRLLDTHCPPPAPTSCVLMPWLAANCQLSGLHRAPRGHGNGPCVGQGRWGEGRQAPGLPLGVRRPEDVLPAPHQRDGCYLLYTPAPRARSGTMRNV